MIKIAPWINGLIEREGYELVAIDRPSEGDSIASFCFQNCQTVCAVTQVRNVSHHPVSFIVIKKIKYRPVEAPRDLGKVCEFSSTALFQAGKILYGSLKAISILRDGSIDYDRSVESVIGETERIQRETYRFARIKDE